MHHIITESAIRLTTLTNRRFHATLTTASYIVKGELRSAVINTEKSTIIFTITAAMKKPAQASGSAWESHADFDFILPPEHTIRIYPSGDIYIPLPRAESLLLHVW